jgi:hypothetical protein
MAEIQWTAPAFVQLETLPQSFAFEVIRRVEVCSIVRMHGSYHGELPNGHSSVGPVNAAGDYLRLADLRDEQRIL